MNPQSDSGLDDIHDDVPDIEAILAVLDARFRSGDPLVREFVKRLAALDGSDRDNKRKWLRALKDEFTDFLAKVIAEILKNS